MSETANLILSLSAGVLLGTIFFGGLWWTTRKGLSSPGPVIWFFASFLLRMLIALGGFYFVGRGDWRRLVACLAGFLLARSLVTRLIREPGAKSIRMIAGGGP